MYKLSKIHQVKTAEEAAAEKEAEELKEEGEEKEPEGADVDGDADDDEDEDEDEEEAELEGEAAEGEDGEKDEEELEGANPKKHKATLEAATPHAHAAKDLFAKRRELMNQVSLLDDELGKHREVLRALDPMAKHQAYADDKELRKFLKPEKDLDGKKKKKKKKLDKKSEQEVMSGLVKVADVLDYAGDHEGVSLVENVLRIFAKKDKPAEDKYGLETIEKTPRAYADVPAGAPSLSTRHCPDHHGISLKRVAEGSFQCELDGRIYNWNQGFKDYSGNVYVSAPPRSVDFPDTSERMYETRELATKKNVK